MKGMEIFPVLFSFSVIALRAPLILSFASAVALIVVEPTTRTVNNIKLGTDSIDNTWKQLWRPVFLVTDSYVSFGQRRIVEAVHTSVLENTVRLATFAATVISFELWAATASENLAWFGIGRKICRRTKAHGLEQFSRFSRFSLDAYHFQEGELAANIPVPLLIRTISLPMRKNGACCSKTLRHFSVPPAQRRA